MPDPGVSSAASRSLASLSSQYDAVTAAAKVAYLTNDLFRISTDQVVISNNAAVASLASLSSHYTAVAAAAKAAHLGNNLFRIGTGQVVKSNAATATSLAAVGSAFAAVAAAAAATAEAIEAARATLGAAPGASSTPGSTGNSATSWDQVGWTAAAVTTAAAIGVLTGNPLLAAALTPYLVHGATTYGPQTEDAIEKGVSEAVGAVRDFFVEGWESFSHPLPANDQARVDQQMLQDVGPEFFQIDMYMDGKHFDQRYLTREDMYEARRWARRGRR